MLPRWRLGPRLEAGEKKITAVVSGPADVGIFRRLVRFQRHGPANGGEQALAFQHVGIIAQCRHEGLGEHRVLAAAGIDHGLQPTRDERRA